MSRRPSGRRRLEIFKDSSDNDVEMLITESEPSQSLGKRSNGTPRSSERVRRPPRRLVEDEDDNDDSSRAAVEVAQPSSSSRSYDGARAPSKMVPVVVIPVRRSSGIVNPSPKHALADKGAENIVEKSNEEAVATTKRKRPARPSTASNKSKYFEAPSSDESDASERPQRSTGRVSLRRSWSKPAKDDSDFSAASISSASDLEMSAASEHEEEESASSELDDVDAADLIPLSDEEVPSRAKSNARSKGTVKAADWKPEFRAGRPIKLLPGIPDQVATKKILADALRKQERGEFPPIHDLHEIFEDLVDRAPATAIKELAEILKNKPLRVATMCSGTESPILAWGLIEKAIEKKFGIAISHEHVFSCEIEPFKQAYIHRNFAPPLLFRDVCELGDDQAHTAFGSLADVPGNVDILIAGTSCVDYSALNTHKKGINDGGESGRTFWGMLKWVEKHQPSVVILENVKSAPWPAVGDAFADMGYDAAFSNLFDTKNYYIPHTRQRGYLVATRNRKLDLAENWKLLAQSLVRPASSPLEAFLLPTDDNRIQHVRQQFSRGEGISKPRTAVDWSRCQGRHESAREFEELGKGRPFTDWKEAGTCKLAHDAWNEWALPQPERVMDLMDITTLRFAKEDIDPFYKSKIWELSQNVDRNIASSKAGICPCLTPSGMPFLTSRGGPLIGLECLSLQGLPINELLLTRETNDQLQNLAGNAMSSTVVGTCVLSALLVARSDLRHDRHNRDEEMGVSSKEAQSEANSAIVDEGSLQKHSLDLTTCESTNLEDVLKLADSAAQRCACEGRELMTARQIYVCKQCGHTACERCRGRPEHDFVLDDRKRTQPSELIDKIRKVLPMRIKTGELLIKSILDLSAEEAGFEKGVREEWADRVSQALDDVEFRFRAAIRQRTWIVQYSSANATLELVLDSSEPQWRVFVHPESTSPTSSKLRSIFAHAVAHMPLDASHKKASLVPLETKSQKWKICLPVKRETKVSLKSRGEQVMTWAAAMGLEGRYVGQKRYSQIEISDSGSSIADSVAGTYQLLPKCGTANGSLHVRVSDKKNDRKVFFFLDADRFKGAESDRYVFSTDMTRHSFASEREVLAQVQDGWKPELVKPKGRDEVEQSANLIVGFTWVECPALCLSLPSKADSVSTVALPPKPIQLRLDTSDCKAAIAILSCSSKLSVQDFASEQLRFGDSNLWHLIDLEHKSMDTFGDLAWIMSRVPEVKALQGWMNAKLDKNFTSCDRCAPQAPDLLWLRQAGKATVPIENEEQAGPYEQALRHRPEPFVMQVRLDAAASKVSVRLGLNALTLMHRALARLPTPHSLESVGAATVSWRLSALDSALTMFNIKPYTLTSNRRDAEAPNPKNFVLSLRPEQRRSLTWMLAREKANVQPFHEEEVSEALLSPMGWRAEGRALRPVQVRGGVLADAVGYGKTAISLALVASSPASGIAPQLPASTGEHDAAGSKPLTKDHFIPTKATLVIVPPHLCKQWEGEVAKFAGSSLKVIVIFAKKDLNKTTIADILAADLVIMSVSVYNTDSYFDSLSRFAAGNPLPAKAGRFFESALGRTLASVRRRAKELQTEGSRKVWQSIKNTVDTDESLFTTHKAKGRVVGEAYAKLHQEGKDNEKDELDLLAPEDENEPLQHKAKKAKGKSKAAQKITQMSDGEAEFSASDEDERPKKKAKKAMPKATKVVQETPLSDIWGLESKSAQQDWRMVKAPPLEMFYWSRVIVDEFHYISNKGERALPCITSLHAGAKWVLSGTPPTADFADVKSIAIFLNVHLGVDDDDDTLKASVKGRRERQRTAAEKFQNFVEMRSPAWHHRRQIVAQSFLDHFVRQNVAEIDEIPSVEILRPVLLPAAERACYLELAHSLEALELRFSRKIFKATTAKGKVVTAAQRNKADKQAQLSDRDARLRRTLGESSSPEEALSRQAAHFTLEHQDDGDDVAHTAIEACDFIVAEREQQRKDCIAQLEVELRKTLLQHDYIIQRHHYRNGQVGNFVKFVGNALSVGDAQCRSDIEAALVKAGCANVSMLTKAEAAKRLRGDDLKAYEKKRAKDRASEMKGAEEGGKAPKLSGDEAAWEEERVLRNMAHFLQRLRNEYVQRQCSLRYFTAIRDLQRAHMPDKKHEVRCPNDKCKSGDRVLKLDNIALSSTCGHTGCTDCMTKAAKLFKCCDPACAVGNDPMAVISASALGIEAESKTRYGIKLAQLSTLIKSVIPAQERVLLFVQFDGLLEKVAEALAQYDIPFVRISGTAHQRSTQLNDFQNGTQRVLLLNIADESAAGSNLTSANHVIFLAPLVSEEAQQYHATMQQARGRAIRFGQIRKVHVWRFVCVGTIDQTTYEHREATNLDIDASLERFEELIGELNVVDVDDTPVASTIETSTATTVKAKQPKQRGRR